VRFYGRFSRSVQRTARLVPLNGFWEGTMKFLRRRFLHLAVGTVSLPAMSRLAAAQAYPSRPITIIDPSLPVGHAAV
jgi:hypothetical protein